MANLPKPSSIQTELQVLHFFSSLCISTALGLAVGTLASLCGIEHWAITGSVSLVAFACCLLDAGPLARFIAIDQVDPNELQRLCVPRVNEHLGVSDEAIAEILNLAGIPEARKRLLVAMLLMLGSLSLFFSMATQLMQNFTEYTLAVAPVFLAWVGLYFIVTTRGWSVEASPQHDTE